MSPPKTEDQHPVAVDRGVAALVYQLGHALVRFRWYAELNCLAEREEEEANLASPAVPKVVDMWLGKIRLIGALAGDRLPVAAGESVKSVVCECLHLREAIGTAWVSDGRRRVLAVLRAASDAEGKIENIHQLIKEAGLGSTVWRRLNSLITELVGKLRPPLSQLLELSRLLSVIAWPSFDELEPSVGGSRTYDPNYVLGEIAPQVIQLLAAIHGSCDLLGGVTDAFSVQHEYEPDKVDEAATQLHEQILDCLDHAPDPGSSSTSGAHLAGVSPPPSEQITIKAVLGRPPESQDTLEIARGNDAAEDHSMPPAGGVARAGTPTLTPHDESILEALRTRHPVVMSLYDLESATSISRRTLGERVNNLIVSGLADRPHGARRGVTITSAGLAWLNSRAQIAH